MEITWYGHACFELKNNAATIVTDPYDNSLGLAPPTLHADIVSVSHNNPRHNAVNQVQGNYSVLDSPGEYEIKEVFITSYALYPPKADAATALADRNIIFFYEMDNLTVCHLGDISHVPTQSQVEAVDQVDILLIPVGNGRSLNATQASEVIGIIEPAIVIPMHYALPGMAISLDPLEKFLKEMGLAQIEAQPKLRIAANNLPPETQTVILTAKNQGSLGDSAL